MKQGRKTKQLTVVANAGAYAHAKAKRQADGLGRKLYPQRANPAKTAKWADRQNARKPKGW